MDGWQTLIARAPKILFLTPGCFDKGGISRYSRYQIEALRELVGSNNLRALSLLGPDPDGFETPFDVTWHGSVPRPTFVARCRFVIQALRHAIGWRPDVIHCAHVNLTPLVTLLKRLSGATTVLNVYGLELWSGLSKTRAAHLARIDRVISDCHATAHHVVSEQMHPAAPTVIWDCADLDRFRPGPPSQHLAARYGLPDLDAHRVVLTLGRLAVSARHKGFDRLLDTWGNVRERIPKARLVIAGQGDDADRLEAKAAELGHADSVIFTGPIDERDLAAIYRAAHVFCLVSDKGPGRGEGIPLTPIEALASGLPVVVGDEDGSSEAVDGCRNGIVVSPRDLCAITNALVTLITETGDARTTRVIEARAVAEERFCYQAFVFNHKNFYDSLLGQN